MGSCINSSLSASGAGSSDHHRGANGHVTLLPPCTHLLWGHKTVPPSTVPLYRSLCGATKVSLNASDGPLTCADERTTCFSYAIRFQLERSPRSFSKGSSGGQMLQIFDVMKLEKQHLDGVIREWNPGSEALVPYWPYNAGGVLYWPRLIGSPVVFSLWLWQASCVSTQ